MRVFLAGTAILKQHPEQLKQCRYILESYYSVEQWQMPFLKGAEMYLMDSGAFTFMQKKKQTNWEEYIEKYAEFVKENDVPYFFELDIDNIVGYEKTKQYRKRLETITGKRSIPVWHKERGIDEYRAMTKDYDYIGLGGLVKSDYDRISEKYFTALIETAHSNGCRIHGLGYTNGNGLHKYHFDTVDSTTWNVGGKYGNICRFNGRTMEQIYTKGKRCVKQKELMLNNYGEWLKFQRYADTHL